MSKETTTDDEWIKKTWHECMTTGVIRYDTPGRALMRTVWRALNRAGIPRERTRVDKTIAPGGLELHKFVIDREGCSTISDTTNRVIEVHYTTGKHELRDRIRQALDPFIFDEVERGVAGWPLRYTVFRVTGIKGIDINASP